MAKDKPQVEEAFPLSEDELNALRLLDTEQRLLKSEAGKLQLRQDNLFLRIQIRTGKNMEGWGLDLAKGLCLPPSSRPPTQPPKAQE